jgi:hypothetical protein
MPQVVSPPYEIGPLVTGVAPPLLPPALWLAPALVLAPALELVPAELVPAELVPAELVPAELVPAELAPALELAPPLPFVAPPAATGPGPVVDDEHPRRRMPIVALKSRMIVLSLSSDETPSKKHPSKQRVTWPLAIQGLHRSSGGNCFHAEASEV